jgi:hypothetical protein
MIAIQILSPEVGFWGRQVPVSAGIPGNHRRARFWGRYANSQHKIFSYRMLRIYTLPKFGRILRHHHDSVLLRIFDAILLFQACSCEPVLEPWNSRCHVLIAWQVRPCW